MKNSQAKKIALGGMMAALAMVIMCLGGLIPVATYICPLLCMVLLVVVERICGKQIAWAWYGAVAFLSVLLAPDKEAAFVFVFLGYYPLVKPKLDAIPAKILRWCAKLALFVTATIAMYAFLTFLLGMTELLEEFSGMGRVMWIITLILGIATFLLTDLMLDRIGRLPIGRRK